MEGFDPRTGTTTWSMLLANPASSTMPAQWAGENAVVVTDSKNRPVSVDLTSGAVSPAGRYLCDQVFRTASGWSQPPAGGAQEPTAYGYDWCSGSAKVAPAGPWPSWLGAQVGDVRVVLTAGGLKGFRQA